MVYAVQPDALARGSREPVGRKLLSIAAVADTHVNERDPANERGDG